MTPDLRWQPSSPVPRPSRGRAAGPAARLARGTPLRPAHRHGPRPAHPESSTGIAAALLTLDASGPAPVQLHVASDSGELAAALAVIDVIDAMAAPVHALVTSEAGGAVVAVLAAAEKRTPTGTPGSS